MDDGLTEYFICLFRGSDEHFEMFIGGDIPAESNSQRTAMCNFKFFFSFFFSNTEVDACSHADKTSAPRAN